MSQPPGREHFLLHTTVESWGPRGKLEVKDDVHRYPTSSPAPPRQPTITASKHIPETPYFNVWQYAFRPLQSFICWLSIWIMQNVTHTPCLPRICNVRLVRLKMLLQPVSGRKALLIMGHPVSCPFPLSVPDSALWVSSWALCPLLGARHGGWTSLIRGQTGRVSVPRRGEIPQCVPCSQRNRMSNC